MGDLDLDNCIKLFKLEDSKSSEQSNDNIYAIKPVGELNVFQAIPHIENEGESQASGEWNCTKFSEKGIEELIKFRTELEDLFNDCGDILGISAVLWEEISCRLFENGIRVTGKQCHDKWNFLYNEYEELAKTDDEGKILNFKYFAMFENVYKIRSEFLVERIVEDVVQFESERGSSTEEIINDVSKSEDNVKEKDEEKKKEDHAVGKMKLRSHGKKKESQAHDAAWSYCNREECRENVIAHEFNSKDIKADSSSENIQFYWDADSMQCFIDLRLYVDSSPQTKKTVLARYKSIVKFLSKKMLLNGFQISEHDCKQKWNAVIRLYNKEINNLRAMDEKNIENVSLSKYFHQIDKVLKKSGRSEFANEGAEVYWSDESVKTLIETRIPLESAFTMFKRYTILWQYVANQIAKANFCPTYKDCAIKWMKLCENYDICLRAMKIGLTEEKIAWKFFKDMHKAFEQNAKNSKAVIEYLETNGSEKDFGSFGKIKIEADPAQYSTTSGSLINSETPAIGNLETVEKFGDPIVFYNSKAEDKKDPMKVIEDQQIRYKEEILDEVEDKARSSKNDEDSGEYFKTFTQSDFSCDKECNCPKSMLQWTDEATLLLLGWRRNKELEFKNTTPDNIELWKFIATQMRNVGYNVCYESCRSYWYHLKEMPKRLILESKKNTGFQKPRKNSIASSKISTAKSNGFVWDWRSVTILIELKFCKGIRELIKYGKTIATRMQAAGYNVTPTECTGKWIKLKGNYNRCLKRKLAGRDIKWEYFQLMNRHFENLASEMELDIKTGKSPPQWIYNCVENLTKLKSSYEKSLVETESAPANSQVKDIIEQSVDISFVNGKRKADEEFGDDRTIKKLSVYGENIQRVDKPIRVSDKDEEMIEETAAVDLSTKVIVPISEQNSPQNITAVNDLDVYKSNNKVEITKENVACFALDNNNGTPVSEKIIRSKEMAQLRILCEQTPRNEIFSAERVRDNRGEASIWNKSQSFIGIKYDVPIQDQSVNSTQYFRVEKKSEWSEAATDLLIDLRIEHELKFPSGYSERSDILWDKIAAQMAASDYNFTRAECWQKWCSLRRTYENMIEDIQEKRVIQTWPYFGKLDSIYKTLGKIYRGFKWILPKKRTHVEVDNDYNNDSRELNLSLSNKLIILVLPSKSTNNEIPISDTEN